MFTFKQAARSRRSGPVSKTNQSIYYYTIHCISTAFANDSPVIYVKHHKSENALMHLNINIVPIFDIMSYYNSLSDEIAQYWIWSCFCWYFYVAKKKDGNCPPSNLIELKVCATLCRHDFDCLDAKKCCPNGCGQVCEGPDYTSYSGKSLLLYWHVFSSGGCFMI